MATSLSGNHLRYNPLNRQWVIYAPNRSTRPGHTQNPGQPETKPRPGHDPECPFCPGNEAMLPGIIHQVPPDADPWLTRVVPNKYAAVNPEQSTEPCDAGPYRAAGACGVHEVIIETPVHNHDLSMLSVRHIEHILQTYLDRCTAIHNGCKAVKSIILFRNHGLASGTSLPHPHSQIMALPFVPQDVDSKQQAAQSYIQYTGRCLLCDMIAWEKQQASRCVYENASFVVFVPFAAQVPCETWIVPKRHDADFARLADGDRPALAQALKAILLSLKLRLNDPDYNYIIHSASPSHDRLPGLHWYIQIHPRTVTPAGFEIGSGCVINPSLPEADAEVLREAVTSIQGDLEYA